MRHMKTKSQIASFVESEVIQPKEKRTVLNIAVKRVSEGIEVSLKSPQLEKFFSISGKNDQPYEWLGQKNYHLPNISDGDMRNLLNAWSSNELFIGSSYPNMSILRSIGLGDGIKVIFPIIASNTDIQKYVNLMKVHTKKLYVEYIKPVNLGVKITTEVYGDLTQEEIQPTLEPVNEQETEEIDESEQDA